MKKLFLLALGLMGVVVADAQNREKKTLVLYYSQMGTTEKVAKLMAQKLDVDIEAIECVKPYDGDFQQTVAEWQKEQASGELRALKPIKSNISQYETVFLGYPIWGGTYAPPVKNLLSNVSLKGKTVVPFCTFGSGGLNTSSDDLKKTLQGTTIAEGYGVRTQRIAAISWEVDEFLQAQGYVKGSYKAPAPFGQQKPVEAADVERFNAACSSYQFPLGTPVTVASRTASHGVEYRYEVNSRGMDGKEARSVIYVLAPANGKAEFTQVVR